MECLYHTPRPIFNRISRKDVYWQCSVLFRIDALLDFVQILCFKTSRQIPKMSHMKRQIFRLSLKGSRRGSGRSHCRGSTSKREPGRFCTAQRAHRRRNRRELRRRRLRPAATRSVPSRKSEQPVQRPPPAPLPRHAAST